MSWIGGIFKKNTDEDSLASNAPTRSSGSAAGSNAVADIQQARELIQRTVYELIHKLGIPQTWFKLEIVTLTLSNQAQFQLQITLTQWEPYLLMHMQAFEYAVHAQLRQKNPAVKEALRAVLWQLGDTAGSPYQQMPSPQAWSPMAIAKRRTALDAALQPNANPNAAARAHDFTPYGGDFSDTMQAHDKEEPAMPRPAGLGDRADFEDTVQVSSSSREAEEAMRRLAEARKRRQESL